MLLLSITNLISSKLNINIKLNECSVNSVQRLTIENTSLSAQLNEHKKMAEEEILKRVEAENLLQTTKEDLDFRDKVSTICHCSTNDSWIIKLCLHFFSDCSKC